MHDILVGLQYGDEGKGKITHSLMKDKKYTHCVRYNGGPNAGHTIYYKGMKVVTHQILMITNQVVTHERCEPRGTSM